MRLVKGRLFLNMLRNILALDDFARYQKFTQKIVSHHFVFRSFLFEKKYIAKRENILYNISR